MADKDQNEEYNFPDLDPVDNRTDNPDYNQFQSTEHFASAESKKDVRRNALIAIAVFVLCVILYKVFSGYYSNKTSTNKNEITSITPVVQNKPVNTAQLTEPVKPIVQNQAAEVALTSELKSKVSTLESNESNVQAQINTMSQQIETANNNISSLNAQVTKLNQMVTDLSNSIGRQSEEISRLIELTKPKIIKRRIHVSAEPPNVYYINAVIPGRAWLIGTNGSTLTIREGVKIPGYGFVKLIDSVEGRILTSSGKVIKFSQSDS